MTLHPFRRKSDISPADQLDAWLNARTPMTPNDNPTEPEGESLAGAAQQFHAWADAVHERDPDAKGPADDLWNVILAGRGRRHVDPAQTDRSVGEMDRTIHAPMGGYAPPKSNRTRTTEATPPLSRSSAWFNAIAAALLLLSLGGGAYLTGNGGFGFGGGDDGRYAAQVASPMASPESNPVVETDHVCNVAGYTEEQAWRIVMNPEYGYQWLMTGEEPESPPDEMWENVSGAFNTVQAWGVERDQGWPPDQTTYDAMEVDANTFWACLNAGTSLQVWSLMDPSVMQSEILINFKVLRSEEDIRGYISTFGNMRYSAALSHAFPDFGGLDNPIRNAIASPTSSTARVVESNGRQRLAWVRMVRDDEGNIGSQTYLVIREFRPGVWIAVAQEVDGALG